MHPSEPFFLAEQEGAPPAPAGAGLLGGFDVLGSAERQATFLWQVRARRGPPPVPPRDLRAASRERERAGVK